MNIKIRKNHNQTSKEEYKENLIDKISQLSNQGKPQKSTIMIADLVKS